MGFWITLIFMWIILSILFIITMVLIMRTTEKSMNNLKDTLILDFSKLKLEKPIQRKK
jgi:preprotein translocase subunit YajC